MIAKLVVIEGTNKSGKTTQAKLLAEFLKKQGFSVLYTKEPQRRSIGNIVRKKLITKPGFSPETIALAFAADTMEHIDSVIKPALGKYEYIICDRYYHSSFAYQASAGCKFEWIKELHRHVIKPDVVFILDVPLGEFRKRIQKSEDIYENDTFQLKLKKAYLDLPEQLTEDFVVIDGTKSKEGIHEKIREIVVKL